MSEEEKKAVEGLKDYVARIKKFHFEQTQGFKWVDITLNLLDNQQKELDNLKEIEKSHQEENGKLRAELEQEKEKNKELEKYDYRKIKFDDRNKIKSPSFTKEQLELMNLGICLYVALPKILTDEENEDEEEI